jgi:archaellum component FlaF (FlaF/FlaG flagellin family)
MSDNQDERRRAIELVIAVAVVVISLASLFTAVYQAVVTRQTLEATVWPRVEWENSNYDEERRASAITIAIANRGVGPARISRAELLLNGERVPNVRSLLVGCCIPGASAEERESAIGKVFESEELVMFTSTVDGAALTPGQQRVLVTFERPAEQSPALPIWDRLNKARDELDLVVCYCSVFDDCWTTKARAFTQTTESIGSCPKEDVPGFTG